jgi:hypothetical protein
LAGDAVGSRYEANGRFAAKQTVVGLSRCADLFRPQSAAAHHQAINPRRDGRNSKLISLF